MNFELEFAYDVEDVRSSRHYLQRRKKSARERLIGFIPLAAFLVPLSIALIAEKLRWPKVISDTAGIILLTEFVAGGALLLRQAMIRGGTIAASPRIHAILNDEELTATVKRKTARYAWSAFERVAWSDRAIFLQFRAGDGICLPHRAFPRTTEFPAVIEWLTDRIGNPVHAVLPLAPTDSQPDHLDFSNEGIAYRKRLERIGGVVLAVGLLAMLGILCFAVVNAKRPVQDWIAIGALGLGYATTVCSSVILARSRGFRTVHGLVSLVPLAGLIFVISRAKPEAGELIHRQTWRGFLTCPIARQSDISGWSRGE